MCHLRVTIGHLSVTVGHPRVTIGHPRVTIGHLRLTIQGVPYHWAHFVFAIFSGSRAHTEELFIAIG